jgi:AmiR/NasT family two-component response regulator
VGAVRLGALDVYRDDVGVLPAPVMAQALTYAEVATSSLLDAQDRAGEESPPGLDDALVGRLELYQAQGMVMVQLGVDLSEALVRLRAYAYSHNRPISDVADDIVARRLTLEGDGS